MISTADVNASPIKRLLSEILPVERSKMAKVLRDLAALKLLCSAAQRANLQAIEQGLRLALLETELGPEQRATAAQPVAGTFKRAGGGGIQVLPKLRKSERRSSVRLYRSWDAARAGSPMPKLSDFDLSGLEDLGGSCFLLVAGVEGPTSRFRYFGRSLAKDIGRDLTGFSLSDVPRSSLLSRVLGHYVEATQRQRPVGINGRFQSSHDDLLYRGILLPFSSAEGQVDAVLGCYRSRATVRAEGRAEGRLE